MEVSVVTNILGEDASFLLYHFSLFQAHCMDRTPLDWGNVYTFRSNHPGGAQFAYADGSIHFLSQSADQLIYRGLCTRNGGEIGKLDQ